MDENSVVRNFRITAKDNKNYKVNHYNLNMVLAIGYRVRSNIGTAFRKRFTDSPTEVEKKYLENMNPLFLIGRRNK